MVLCQACCRQRHERNPFHKVEMWTGSHFSAAFLWEVGLRLYLGHRGLPCPEFHCNHEVWQAEQDTLDFRSQQVNVSEMEDRMDVDEGPIEDRHTAADPVARAPADDHRPAASSAEDEADLAVPAFDRFTFVPEMHLENTPDEQDWEDIDDDPHPADLSFKKPPSEDLLGAKFVTIVDRSGIHHLSIVYCMCDEGRRPEEQLLMHRLFPASFHSISTVFTFALLDDFRLENLECKTTPYQYYQKLRRITNSTFPQSVPNRYPELRRVSRQWRQLKKWKWYGMPYDARTRGPGEMALFCPACPQPGVNLGPRWAADKDK